MNEQELYDYIYKKIQEHHNVGLNMFSPLDPGKTAFQVISKAKEVFAVEGVEVTRQLTNDLEDIILELQDDDVATCIGKILALFGVRAITQGETE